VSSAQVSPARREEQAAPGRALEPPGSPGFVSHPAHTPSLACEVAKAYATVGRYSKTNRRRRGSRAGQRLERAARCGRRRKHDQRDGNDTITVTHPLATSEGAQRQRVLRTARLGTRQDPDRGREAGWRAGLSGRVVPRGCPGVRRVDRGGRQRAFRRSFATLQPRMIVPRLTPLRVTLGTIASRGAAVGVRHAGRSSSADPTSPAVSALAACGIFWLSRKPATRDSCRCHRSGRSRKEAASRWPSLCTWPRKPREPS